MSIWGFVGGLAGLGRSIWGGNKAAKAQSKAAKQALAQQWRMYWQSRRDMMPWMEAGKRSLADLERELGDTYEQSRGYQWMVGEAEKGIKSNLAALGMSNSGAALKRLTDYRLGAAAQDYGTWYNRKAGLAGQGMQMASNLGSLGNSYAGMMGNQYNMLGAARASGYANTANALGNFFEQQSKINFGRGY